MTMYAWRRYRANTGWELYKVGTDSWDKYVFTSSFKTHFYSSYTIQGGLITLSDSVGISDEWKAKECLQQGYKYIPDDVYSSSRKRIYEITSITDATGGRLYGQKLYFNILEAREYSRKGSYIGQVTSTSSTAYPRNGKSGDYWYEYIGVLNEAPTISGKDEDLGGMKKAFTRTFTVDDKDQDQTLKVMVKLNGVSIHTITNATRNTDYTVDITDELFNSLPLNQKNTIEITVDDGNGATTVRRYYFSRVNTPPVVQVNQSNMGEKNTPFSFTYTATDADSDALTGKIYLDDVQVEDVGALTLEKENSYTLKKLDYAKLLNGDHKVRVEVTDANGAKGYGYVNFSKNVKSGFYRLKRETKDVVATVIVNPSVELAEGATMTIKVCNNVYDASPAWETVPKDLIGQSYNLQNKTKTASKWGLGIDVTIDRGSATKDSYFYGLVGSWR